MPDSESDSDDPFALPPGEGEAVEGVDNADDGVGSKLVSIKGEDFSKGRMANIIGISPLTLDRMIRDGLPVAQRGFKRMPWVINSAAAIQWIRHQDVLKARPRDKGAAVGDIDEAKLRRESANARKAELAVEELEGNTITCEAAAAVFANELATVRSLLLSMPGRIAGEVMGLTDRAAIEDIVEREILTVLAELTADDPATLEAIHDAD